MIDYDDAYANAAYIPNAEGFVEKWVCMLEITNFVCITHQYRYTVHSNVTKT